MRNRPVYVVAMFHACAKNDTNGNPRRTFVALGPFGGIVGAWREGYLGTDAVPEPLRELAQRAPDVPTTPKALRELARIGAEHESTCAPRFVDASARLRRNILRAGNASGRRPPVRQ
jgi:hypothetical protein